MMMDVALYKRTSSVDQGDSNKKQKHEDDKHDYQERNHRHSDERHSKHKHGHKHDRHRHGIHKENKHKHRKKSSKGTDDLDRDGKNGDDVADKTRASKEGRSGNVLKYERLYKEEGELSGNHFLTNFKAATESDIESGEIKPDEESTEVEPELEKLSVGPVMSGFVEATEAVSANKTVKAGLVLAEPAEFPVAALSENADSSGPDGRAGHTSHFQCMSIGDDHKLKRHVSDDLIYGIEMVNSSNLLQETLKAMTNVEVESLQIKHSFNGTSENMVAECEIDNADENGKENDFSEDAFGNGFTREVNKFLFVHFGNNLKNEEADKGQSTLLTERGEIETSNLYAPSGSSYIKLPGGKSSLPQDQEGRQGRSREQRHSHERKRSRSHERRQSHRGERKRSHSREMRPSRSHERRKSDREERERSLSRELSPIHSCEKELILSKRQRSHSRENCQSRLQDAGRDRISPPDDLEQNRRHPPPFRSSQARLQKESEGSLERKWHSPSRDCITTFKVNNDTFDRRDFRASLKSSREIVNDRKKLPDSPVKRNRRSRSRESVQNHRTETRESMRRGYGRTASPDRSRPLRSRVILKEGRSENRGTSRYSQSRDKDHETSYKDSQTSRERFRNEELRNRYLETSHSWSRGLEKDSLKHDQSKTGQKFAKYSRNHASEEKAREEENQVSYVERVASQLAAQEEDDVEKIKEESRRRRQAILDKYKNQKSNQQQQSSELDIDMFREVESAKQHAGLSKRAGSSSVLEIGHGEKNGSIGATGLLLYDANSMHDTTLVLGKGPLHLENVLKVNIGGIIALGEGSPKSERSPDMFCDDIFGDSPAGGRRAGKGDGLMIDTSGLTDNWDDAEGYYCYRIGEVLDGRYEVASSHGRGVFSHVVRARDLKAARGDAEEVAIKIIRNNETMFKAGQTELIILKKLAGADPENRRHCVRLLSSFEYRSHLCLVFESLHMNLREVLKKFGRNIGINLHAVRAYAKQLFIALKHLRNCGVLHCDIKPDNMLVNEAKNVLKLCDFGSAMFAGENEITPYLVSRFYRSPEIILGLPYDHALDIWSVGCCLYELYTGKVLFPGPTNNDMLKLHMELKGLFPKKMLKKAAFRDQHFDQDFNFCAVEEDPVTKKMVKRILANVKPSDIGALIGGSCTVDEDSKMVANFKDLLDKVFILDPDKRLTISQGLSHPFISAC